MVTDLLTIWLWSSICISASVWKQLRGHKMLAHGLSLMHRANNVRAPSDTARPQPRALCLAHPNPPTPFRTPSGTTVADKPEAEAENLESFLWDFLEGAQAHADNPSAHGLS